MTSDQVLTRGTLRAGEQLGLAHAELAQVLHLDAQAISAMEAGVEHLRAGAPSGQRAVTLIKIHQALAANPGPGRRSRKTLDGLAQHRPCRNPGLAHAD